MLAVSLSVALLLAALFVAGAIDRAARLAVRGQGEWVADAMRQAFHGLGRPPDRADLDGFLAAHARDGVRYVAVVSPDGALAAATGEPLGEGVTPGKPRRFGRRLRVVLPKDASAATSTLVFELETTAANDIFMAGRIALVVVGVVDVLMIALGVVLSRSLRARDALAARLAAENRLAALGEMSAVLAHELRNPIASLKGNAQLLAEVLPADSAHHTKADRVVREAVRLERLTDDLLEFVRTGELHRRRADPREAVDAAVLSVGEARVAKRYASALPECDLDPDRLRIAIENVLRNAIQAAEGEPVDVAIDVTHGALVITVRDRGPGIPAGEEEAVFRPFQTTKVQGTGLGLAIARRILELHGGIIEASNHGEGGAVFTMTIPSAVRG